MLIVQNCERIPIVACQGAAELGDGRKSAKLCLLPIGFVFLMTATPSITIRDVANALVRRWRMFAVIFFSALPVIIAVLSLWPDKYEANAKLLVTYGRELLPSSRVGDSGSTQVLTTGLSKEDVKTEVEILTGRAVAEQTVDALGLEFFRPVSREPQTIVQFIKITAIEILKALVEGATWTLTKLNLMREVSEREKAIDEVSSSLKVEATWQAHTINLRVRWGDRDAAVQILERVVESYIAQREVAREAFAGLSALDAQVKEVERRMAAVERELREKRIQDDVHDSPRQLFALIERQSALEKMRAETGVKEAELNRRLAVLEMRLENTSIDWPGGEVGENRLLAQLRQRLVDLSLAKSRSDAKRSGSLSSLTGEIAIVRAAIASEERSVVEHQMLVARDQLSVTRARLRGLDEALASVTRLLRSLTLRATEIRALERQLAADENSYTLYRQRREESHVASMLNLQKESSVKVIGRVLSSEYPVAPRKLLIAALGVVASFFGALGTAFLSGWYDNTLRRPEDIENLLGLPCLGSVGEV